MTTMIMQMLVTIDVIQSSENPKPLKNSNRVFIFAGMYNVFPLVSLLSIIFAS